MLELSQVLQELAPVLETNVSILTEIIKGIYGMGAAQIVAKRQFLLNQLLHSKVRSYWHP